MLKGYFVRNDLLSLKAFYLIRMPVCEYFYRAGCERETR
jgi:hypothetical protein